LHAIAENTMATSHTVEELMSGSGTKSAWCGHELAPDFYVPRVEPDRPKATTIARRSDATVCQECAEACAEAVACAWCKKKLCANCRSFSFVGYAYSTPGDFICYRCHPDDCSPPCRPKRNRSTFHGPIPKALRDFNGQGTKDSNAADKIALTKKRERAPTRRFVDTSRDAALARRLQREEALPFAVGDRVEARFMKGSTWYPGEVTRIRPPKTRGRSSTFDVLYDDGEPEEGVLEEYICASSARRRSTTPPPKRVKTRAASPQRPPLAQLPTRTTVRRRTPVMPRKRPAACR